MCLLLCYDVLLLLCSPRFVRREKGDVGLLQYVATLDKCKAAAESQAQDKPFNVVMKAPFPEALMALPKDTKTAIDVAFSNIHKFHAKQVSL